MQGDFLGERRVPISSSDGSRSLSGVESSQTVPLSTSSQDMHTLFLSHSQLHTFREVGDMEDVGQGGWTRDYDW